ncbi:unnamed protein product, partial [Thelazia callipaeda]|uniref:SUEL-type lectin domain-containing protein n=1 Tax=Thelazia callipaeda TaxID=103827 RepID=A0A0N5DAH3_THECL
KIHEQCKNRRKCRITVRASFFPNDPCPDTSKYLQISYKCKPVSFDDEIYCEGSIMQLTCKQNKKLAIYSAQYGQTVEKKAAHCAVSTSVKQGYTYSIIKFITY